MIFLKLSSGISTQGVKRFFVANIILAASTFLSSESFADNCSVCYDQQENSCNAACSAASDEKTRQRCQKTCLIQKCGKLCGYEETGYKDSVNRRKGSAAQPDSHTSNYTDCDYCHRNSRKTCQSDCRGKSASCEKICISRRCSSKCVSIVPPSDMAPQRSLNEDILTGGSNHNNTSHESYPGTFSKRDKCSDCQSSREQGCKGQCGSGAGSLACAVACVERACHQDCLID